MEETCALHPILGYRGAWGQRGMLGLEGSAWPLRLNGFFSRTADGVKLWAPEKQYMSCAVASLRAFSRKRPKMGWTTRSVRAHGTRHGIGVRFCAYCMSREFERAPLSRSDDARVRGGISDSGVRFRAKHSRSKSCVGWRLRTGA